MARRQKICPEITDPELRAFLDTVPSIRRFHTELALSQSLTGEIISIALPGRELSVCFHRAKENGRPVIFEFHGGGFVLGNAEKDDRICDTLCKELDVNVAGVNYRLAPEAPYPAAVDDAYEIMKYFHAHSSEFGIDPAHMGTLGFSGGATLAAAAAFRANCKKELSLCAQALHYPYLDSSRMPDQKEHYPQDMDPAVMTAFTRLYSSEEERKLPEVSPVLASREELAGMPRTLLVPAQFDALKEEGLVYARHLEAAGVSVYCQIMPDTHHGYIEDWSSETVYQYTAEDIKQTHSPYFREWAEAAMKLTAAFFKESFGEGVHA